MGSQDFGSTDFAEGLDHLDEIAQDWIIWDHIQILIKPGLENLIEARRLMGSDYRFGWIRRSDSGDMCHHYYHIETGIGITIRQDADLVDGSTCQRVKTGEKVENLYEIVCV